MKKRLRKKLHIKEYAEYGMMVTLIPIPDGTDQDIAMKVKAIADMHGLACWGGSNEFSFRPNYKEPTAWGEVRPRPVKSAARSRLPEVVTNLLKRLDDGQISGFAMFALIATFGVTINPEVEADVLQAFGNPSYPVYIAYPVDLWTGRNYTLTPHKIYHGKRKTRYRK